MAYSEKAQVAAEVTAHDADKPNLLGKNGCESNNNAAKWYQIFATQTKANGTGTDRTDANFPTKRTHDRHLHLISKPALVPGAFGYGIMFDLKADLAINGIVIAGHNFKDLSGTVNISVWVANGNPFLGGDLPIRIAQWEGVTTSKRLVALDLGQNHGTVTPGVGEGDWKEYTGVQWIQIAIRETGENAIVVPEVGEVLFSTRRQLSSRPNAPFDDLHTRSEVNDFKPRSGVRVRYVRNTGQQVANLEFEPTGDDAYGLDDTITLKSWFKTDCDHGTLPGFWIPAPVTAVDDAYFMEMVEPDFDAPVRVVNRRRVPIEFEEIAPFVVKET